MQIIQSTQIQRSSRIAIKIIIIITEYHPHIHVETAPKNPKTKLPNKSPQRIIKLILLYDNNLTMFAM